MDIAYSRKSKETYLRVENDTFTDIISTHVSKTFLDEKDWETGNSRPDKNFNDQYIRAAEWVEKREEIKKNAGDCTFSMTPYFADGTEDTYSLNQKHAFAITTPLNFQVSNKQHELEAWRKGSTIHVRIENTEAQKKNHLAENQNKRGELYVVQKRYEDALSVLKEALTNANKPKTEEIIKSNIARGHHLLGERIKLEGNELEKKGKVKEAQEKYKQVRINFEEARKFKNTEKYINGEKAIILKIEGDRIFNESVKIEEDSYGLLVKAKTPDGFTKAQSRYKEALVKYEEALKKYEEGAKIDDVWFGYYVNITKGQVHAMNEAITDVDKAALNHLVDSMSEDEYEDVGKNEKSETEKDKKN